MAGRGVARGVALVIALVVLAACTNDSQPMAQETTQQSSAVSSSPVACHAVEPVKPAKGANGMAAKSLANAYHFSLGEATAILGFQNPISEMSAALRNANLDGYDNLYIAYEPCYHIVVRVTQGDGADILTAIPMLGFKNLRPYVTVRHALYSQVQLSAAQLQLDTVLGDLLTGSGTSITNDKVTVMVAKQTDIAVAQQRLQDAFDAGTIQLPLTAFSFEVGTVTPA